MDNASRPLKLLIRSLCVAIAVLTVVSAAAQNRPRRTGGESNKVVNPADIQCDFIIEYRFPILRWPKELHGEDYLVVYFGRYYVTEDDVRAEIIWKEPLQAGAPAGSFGWGTFLIASPEQFTYKEPRSLRDPDVFTDFTIARPELRDSPMSYDIRSARFAWWEYLNQKNLFTRQAAGELPPGWALNTLENGSTCLKHDSSVKYPVEQMCYEYDQSGGLVKSSAVLPQMYIPAAGGIDEVVLSDRAPPVDRNVRYHRNGRRVEVKWSEFEGTSVPVDVAVYANPTGDPAPLPTSLRIREYDPETKQLMAQQVIRTPGGFDRLAALDGLPYRRAQLLNFKKLATDQVAAVTEVKPIDCAFSPAERAWYESLSKDHEHVLLSLAEITDEQHKREDSLAWRLRLQRCHVAAALKIEDVGLFEEALAAYLGMLREAHVAQLDLHGLESLKFHLDLRSRGKNPLANPAPFIEIIERELAALRESAAPPNEPNESKSRSE